MVLKETEITEKESVYKAKDRERKRASRKKVLSPMEAEGEKIQCRERVRLHGLKKKQKAQVLKCSARKYLRK